MNCSRIAKFVSSDSVELTKRRRLVSCTGIQKSVARPLVETKVKEIVLCIFDASTSIDIVGIQ